MNKLKDIGIIPARYASTRFPGKPLAMIGDRMMIERVWMQAKKVLEEAWVATDDQRIYDAVKSFGGDVVMTSSEHKSGTDRCFEAYKNIGSDADVVINIQGDEPFIDESQLNAIINCFDDEKAMIATLVKPFDRNGSYADLENANTPKVVIDEQNMARYFSRSVIPFVRGEERENWPQTVQYYTHIGMYAYRVGVLAEITNLAQSKLEIAESLEQLRWLETGYDIKVGITEKVSIGIDTPEDLARAVELIKKGK